MLYHTHIRLHIPLVTDLTLCEPPHLDLPCLPLGRLGGAMVLGKLPEPGRPTNLD